MKNRIFSTVAIAGLVGALAACEQREETVIEQPVVEQPAPVIVEPAPAPMTTDTVMMHGTAHDTLPTTTPR